MEWITALLDEPRFYVVLRSVLLAVIGWPLIHLASVGVSKLVRHRATEQAGMLLGKAVYYGGILLLVAIIMQNLGFQLTAVLGAAGIMVAAIGFASQTSLSNIISGLFLIGERPFSVGDLIDVGGTVGVVLSIDLLSIKLRTMDNRFIRVPNETLIKSLVITITRFPVRRMDITIGVAYKENVKWVMELLVEIADANPYSLDEPRPLILFKEFGSSSLELLLGVWFSKTDFLNLKNSIMCQIKERFDKEGIEIAFPHLTVYSGSDTKPFPLRITEEEKSSLADANAR